jgi:hypothetical protein
MGMTDHKLHAILEPDGCWHGERVTSKNLKAHNLTIWTCDCGYIINTAMGWSPDNEQWDNPTYDNPALIAEKMRERGLWEEFIYWHECQMPEEYDDENHFRFGEIWEIAIVSGADIITTPALLSEAIISWHELTHVWKGDRYAERA